MELCQVKQSLDGAHSCDELPGDLLCCKNRLQSHLNVHLSHLNGRLLLWISLSLARELLCVSDVTSLRSPSTRSSKKYLDTK